MRAVIKRTFFQASALLGACLLLGVVAQGAWAEAPLPVIESVTPAEETVVAGTAITPVVIKGTNLKTVTAEGLPAELSLNEVGTSETEWEITGTPTTAKPQTPITIKAENSEGKAAAETKTYKLTVQEPLPVIGTVTPAEETVVAGTAIKRVVIKGTTLKTVTAEGLPAELSLKAVGGTSETEWEITGTPTTAKPQTPITIKAENTEGKAAAKTKTYKLTVQEPLPVIGTVTPAEETVVAGTAIKRVVIKGTNLKTVTAEGLPAELSLKEVSETEWEITGTPTTAKTQTTITIKAKNSEGKAAAETKTYKLTVQEPVPLPVIASVTPAEETVVAGTAIKRVVIKGTNLKTVTAEGLPAELSLKEVSETEWEITGTPTTAKTQTTITIKAKNSEGKAAAETKTYKLTATTPVPASNNPTPKIETPSAPPPSTPSTPTPTVTSAGRLGTIPTQKQGSELFASFLCEVQTCTVTISAVLHVAKKTLKLHSAATKIAKGKKVKILIKLTKKERQQIAEALKKHKKVTAALSAAIHSSVGYQVTRALTVTVKR